MLWSVSQGGMNAMEFKYLWHDAIALCCRAWGIFRAGWIWFTLIFIDTLLLAGYTKMSGIDAQFAPWVAVDGQGREVALAQFLSFWGDWPTGTLLFCAVTLAIGIWRNSRKLQALALAVLFASSIAGIGANTIRLSAGRPRPHVQKPDGFYGPFAVMRFERKEDGSWWEKINHYAHSANRYQSFPSGHSATAMGTATAALIACPPVGVPLAIFAVGVCWSRMSLQRHYIGDVVVGSAFGVIAGICFGLSARRGGGSRLRRPGEIEAEIVE